MLKEERLTKKQKKIFTLFSFVLFLLFFAAVCLLVGKPMIRFVSEPQKFRAWVDSHGLIGKIIFMGMLVFQVVFALIPGEPLEIGAGYAFGAIEGTVLCLIGITVGSCIVFMLVRTLGVRVVEVFFSVEKIMSLKFLKNTKRLNTVTFLIYFIPGTPKDLITYFIGLTKIKFSTWVIISALARIPSVVTSTVGGNALGVRKYEFAVIVFIATLAVSGIGVLIYKLIVKKHNQRFGIDK